MSKMMNPIDFPEPKFERSSTLGLVVEQRITRTPSEDVRVVEVYRFSEFYMIKLVRINIERGMTQHSLALSNDDVENSVDPTIAIRYFLERTPLLMNDEAVHIPGLAARIHYLVELHKSRSK